MIGPSHAVFLSYASQDTQAAQRIAKALRAADIEVFLDQSELRGGDAWDQKIRQEIQGCALFIPVVSQHTQERLEGYFRHEWKLAVERAHHMAEQKVFLVPIVVDWTRDQDALVPDAFRAVQWTRLPNGETPPIFVERIRRLLSPTSIREPTSAQSGTAGIIQASLLASSSPERRLLLAVGVAALGAAVYLSAGRLGISNSIVSPSTHSGSAAPTTFSPPPHSIAVLPFVNLSGDTNQEYFSEGLTEELLNSLSRINGLQVAARTSSFSFQREHPDIATVARKLNVAAVLEGSVRRAGNTVRITAELDNAVTGFQFWSMTYDRNLGDVLKLQTEIATAVANALKLKLLDNISHEIELGGTRVPAAFDAYLRASKLDYSIRDENDLPSATAAYTEAIRLDPRFAIAFANRSTDLTEYTANAATGVARRDGFEKAEGDARQALALAPGLAEAHLALAIVLEQGSLDFAQANEEYERALALAPGNARVLRDSALFAADMGHFAGAIAAARQGVLIDPLNSDSYGVLAQVLHYARRNREAALAATEAIGLDPGDKADYPLRGFAYYALADLKSASTSCEATRDYWQSKWCLAVVYYKLGRHADAEAELKQFQATLGDGGAYQYATIYAQWGAHSRALHWLDTAMHLHDPGLEYMKVDPLLDPLRQEVRFQGLMRELAFPE